MFVISRTMLLKAVTLGVLVYFWFVELDLEKFPVSISRGLY